MEGQEIIDRLHIVKKLIDADDINGITITNTGTMTATDDFGLYMRNATGTLSINNSGTITSAIYPMYYTIKSGGSATLNLTNSGTITLTDGHPYDTIALQANATVTNTGTISGGRYALTFNGSGIDVVNKGTVDGITYDFMSSTDGNLANLTNGQGGNDCVNWYGYSIILCCTWRYERYYLHSGCTILCSNFCLYGPCYLYIDPDDWKFYPPAGNGICN